MDGSGLQFIRFDGPDIKLPVLMEVESFYLFSGFVSSVHIFFLLYSRWKFFCSYFKTIRQIYRTDPFNFVRLS